LGGVFPAGASAAPEQQQRRQTDEYFGFHTQNHQAVFELTTSPSGREKASVKIPIAEE
jgi:hypothetical protein